MYKKIAHLISLALFGLENETQRAELEEWLGRKERNRRLYKRLQEEGERSLEIYAAFDADKAWQRVEKRLRRQHYWSLARRAMPYAAAVLVVLGVGIYALSRWNVPAEPQVLAEETALLPGSSKARLLTEGGEVFDLETEGVLQVDGKRLENDGERLVYGQGQEETGVRRHTLQVPRGGEYHLVLADGTQVWLNAETELTYPTAFPGDNRRVRVKGEAYFEVAKDEGKPFIVEMEGWQVQVLGTAFNVSAYPAERQHVTLAGGCVRAIQGEEVEVLSPGEQAEITSQGMAVREVNVENYTAWRKKRFVFRSEPFPDLVKELERWYDVRIILDEGVRDIRLTVNLPKYEELNKLLTIIEDIARVDCKVQGREIMIKKE